MIKLQLNDKLASNHFILVEARIKNRITSVLNRGYVGRAPNRLNLTVNLRTYFNNLLVGNNLQALISVKPIDLPGLITGITNIFPSFAVPNSVENLILRNVFIKHGYDNPIFSKWNFIKNSGIDTCPYCNRNYIYYLSRTSEIKPQIDHFFPKSKYPFLALSYYNLVPSCQTCNGFGAKEEKDPNDEDLINPYLIEPSDFKFTYETININFLNPLIDKDSVKVKFLHALDGHLEVFQLEGLYKQHSDHVLELIIKSKVSYSEEYRKYLASYNGLSFSDKEIDRMILGNYSELEEIHKRPLAKLYQDIGKQLGLIS